MVKKISSFVLAFTFFVTLSFAQSVDNSNAPKMVFKKTVHDFKTIKEKIGKASYLFTFKNDGKSPLIIKDIKTSCGCTTPEYTREPVLPGKKGKIKITYSTLGRPGTFNKKINVYTNVSDTIYVLTIKGFVVPD